MLAPIVAGRDPRPVLQELSRAGFVRVKIDGKIHELSEEIHIKAGQPHEIDLIVDRLALRPGIERRLADSLEIASLGIKSAKNSFLEKRCALPRN